MGEIELRPDRWRDDDIRSVVVMIDETPAAAGLIWRTKVHPGAYWADVVVAPEHRRRGIGTAVVAHLAHLRARPLPFKTRGHVDDARLRFADALGARTVQVVPPGSVSVAARTRLRARADVRTVREATWADVLDANARTYEWTHRSWAPVGDDFAEGVNAGLADEIDLDASSVALDPGGRILALALAYPDDPRTVITAETCAPDTDDGERLVEGCVRATLDHLAGHGVSDVEFDGHISDPHFLPVWARLSPTGRWFRIVELDPPIHP
jgi:GNAT superfamily N-acetyltransferase